MTRELRLPSRLQFPRVSLDANRAVIRYRAESGLHWEASRFGFNGGFKGEPRKHYVDATIEYPGYGGCSHEIELTRDDLVTMLAMVDQANEWSREGV